MSFWRSYILPMTMLGYALFSFSASSRGDDLPEMTKTDGPYMVLAYQFRGPESEMFARALAEELRKDHDLPSFAYRSPDKKESSSVLVGNCKTRHEAYELCRRVKKIKAKCLPDSASPTTGSGLSRAVTTTNPLVKID